METKWDEMYWLDRWDKLSRALALVGPGLIASGYFLAQEFPANLSVMQEQIDDGEDEYVFTLLCEKLQEHRIPISPVAYALLEEVGTMIADCWADVDGDFKPNYPPEMWQELKPLVVPPLTTTPTA